MKRKRLRARLISFLFLMILILPYSPSSSLLPKKEGYVVGDGSQSVSVPTRRVMRVFLFPPSASPEDDDRPGGLPASVACFRAYGVALFSFFPFPAPRNGPVREEAGQPIEIEPNPFFPSPSPSSLRLSLARSLCHRAIWMGARHWRCSRRPFFFLLFVVTTIA